MVYTKSETDCDECGRTITDGENCYCERCYSGLQDVISKLEDKVNDLESQLVAEKLEHLE